MEVRPGYKQTEVGVIPEDWDVYAVRRMGEVAPVRRWQSTRREATPLFEDKERFRWANRH